MVGFGKTICSICYEDLKPIVEDLQSISICGHVFHELCIQQWFEYCPNGKKKKCPVCKQTCSEENTNRLYFQSVGDPNDTSAYQKERDYEGKSQELRNEVKRLEKKVLGLTSTLEQQLKDIKDVNAELLTCKEQLKMEVSLKNEAVRQKEAIQQLLHRNSKELDRSNLECIRLQDRNMVLVKELSALKLVCDLNLEEEKVLKLALLGNKANSKHTVDALKKSLVIRNESYKELMTKCDTLDRRMARSLRKREKAKEKINKLKARVKELEMAVEGKENEILRASKKNFEVDQGGKEFKVDGCSCENQNKAPIETEVDLHQVAGSCDDSSRPRRKRKYKSKDVTVKNTVKYVKASDLHKNNQEKDSFVRNEKGGTLETSSCVDEVSYQNLKQSYGQKNPVKDSVFSRPESAIRTSGGTQVPGSHNKDEISGSRSCSKNSTVHMPDVIILDDDGDLPHLDDITQQRPSFHIRKETSSPVILAQPGDRCFSGGLLGPDGTNWHLGKWCKKVKDKGSGSLYGGSLGSGASGDDLIAVGADDRGSRTKVLASVDNGKSSPSFKRRKHGTSASGSLSQGCLPIEHFFQKER